MLFLKGISWGETSGFMYPILIRKRNVSVVVEVILMNSRTLIFLGIVLTRAVEAGGMLYIKGDTSSAHYLGLCSEVTENQFKVLYDEEIVLGIYSVESSEISLILSDGVKSYLLTHPSLIDFSPKEVSFSKTGSIRLKGHNKVTQSEYGYLIHTNYPILRFSGVLPEYMKRPYKNSKKIKPMHKALYKIEGNPIYRIDKGEAEPLPVPPKTPDKKQ